MAIPASAMPRHRRRICLGRRREKGLRRLMRCFPATARGNVGETPTEPAHAPCERGHGWAGHGPWRATFQGISTPSVEDVVPVRPIFTMNKDDAEGLEQEANLAAMPWEDFEHLVRQLFEWEFGRHGAEVRLTRASRDRGVDAIIFDPDPLRGGFGRRPDLRAARPWQRGHAWSHLPYTSPSGGGLWPPSRLPFQLESRPIRL